MFEYTVNRLNSHITQLTDATEVSMFLITGEDRAILIDTGVGLKGLKEKVEELTNLPYDVILTHGHGDHGSGAAEFDSVYIFPADKELAIMHTKEMRYSYTDMMLEMISGRDGSRNKVIKDDFVPELDDNYVFKDLSDGQEFELGGVTVKIIAVPGHTKGTCCILVKEDRMILLGDACNPNTLVGGPESTTISEYRKSLLYLKTYEEQFDTTLYSHGPVIAPSCIDDNIELCNKILAGTDDKIPEEGFAGSGFLAAKRRKDSMERTDSRFGNIYYTALTAK